MLMKALSIDAPLFNQTPAQGISHPLPVIASDGNVYFLKNYKIDNSDDFDAMFFQEALSVQLAQKLNIPVPDWAIIKIDVQTLNDFPELQFQYKFEPNEYYYATKKVDNVANDLVTLLNEEVMLRTRGASQKLHNIFKKISNKNDIPSILLLDYWTSNVDRFTNSGNLILRVNKSGNYLIAIDFGHCFFGPYWDKNTQSNFREIINTADNGNIRQMSANLTSFYLRLAKVHAQNNWKLGIVFDLLQKQISFNGMNPFDETMSRINNIDSNQIIAMMNKIPASWIVRGDEQKSLYLQYLNAQKIILADLIQYQAEQELFTNFNGGTLEWRKEKNISTQ